MQVAHLYPLLQQIVSKVLCHTLSQRGHQHTLLLRYASAHLINEVINLPFGGLDSNLRIHQTSRANYLLYVFAIRGRKLEIAWGGGHVYGLSDPLFKLIKGQRAVIHCGRQTETEFDQVALARHIALEHAANLWNCNV